MEHHQKYVSSNIIDKYFNDNTLVHQKDFVNNVTLHYVIGGQKLGTNGDTLFRN